MRIAKAIAHAGLCSRRDAERMIEAGRVAVNGKVLTTPAHVVDRHRQDHRRWQAAAASRSAAALALQQAARPGDQPQGPARPKDRVRSVAGELTARRLGRTARHQHRRASAADDRRRARPPSRAAEHRLAQALPRARPWPGHPGGARRAPRRHNHRRRSITGRVEARIDREQGSQSLAHARACARARTAR